MAKTRLNKWHRADLEALAEQKLKQATREYTKPAETMKKLYWAHLALIDLVQELATKRFPTKEMKVLSKWGCTDKLDHVRFKDIEADEEAHQLFRMWHSDVLNYGLNDGDYQKFLGRNVYLFMGTDSPPKDADKSTKKFLMEWWNKAPAYPTRIYNPTLACTTDQFKIVKRYFKLRAQYEREYEEVQHSWYEGFADYQTLIREAKTFEDVVEVWSEAEELRDKICKTGTSLVVVCDETKQRIAADVAARAAA